MTICSDWLPAEAASMKIHIWSLTCFVIDEGKKFNQNVQIFLLEGDSQDLRLITHILSFCQNDLLMGESFWQNNSLVTHILFELCLL